MRRAILVSLTVVAALIAAARPIVRGVDRLVNTTPSPRTTAPSAPALALHRTLWVADFHTDALLWGRNLLTRSPHGHVDLPRLIDGGIDFEAFSVVTRYPIASNYSHTPASGDVMPLLAMASGWPSSTWFDPCERALLQARTLQRAAAASRGRLRVVETRSDFDSLLNAQARGDTVVGAVLLLEGMHALDGRINAIDTLFAAGFRVFGVAHMFDNAVGGSAHGWRKGGLTAFGRRAIARIDSLGGIIDLAHASPATIDDVLRATARPLLISHTGAAQVCPGPRNLPDDVLARIGARGGLIAVGFWAKAVCGRDAAAIARSIHHVARVAGIDHVALGSDFDGAVRTPFDAAGLALVTDALISEGLSTDEIRLVMGENAKKFVREMLPAPR